ncbi:protein YhfH [Paenibacillus flagellatus]|uniref:YhfH family protein n=1 Tax=Paenibacillus flagellatus TaxID=2211139 RepID=A0A2V5KCY5_9BACL|nr:YhfH family protein [Paenibacillus flagellatus]
MLPPAHQFFETLPQKQCAKCGTVMEEQSECYTHVCVECSGGTVYPFGFKLVPVPPK